MTDTNGSMVKEGIYKKCRVQEEDIQYGESSKGTPEIVLQVFVPDLNRHFSTLLYFSEGGAPGSFERLRACGWEGDDLSNLKGVGKNDIDFSIRYEEYQGEQKMKTSIMTGGGRIETSKAMDPKSFAAKVAMITGKGSVPKDVKPPPFG